MSHFLSYSALVVVADQITKQIVRTEMTLGQEPIRILGDFFRLTYVENSGIAFGINFDGGPPLFKVASIVATIVVGLYLWKVRHRRFALKLSLALILGGAVGNLIDRILFDKVVDFLEFGIAGYYWPVFNVADSCVTIGIILFLYLSFWGAKESKPELA